ncbi:hypothetical protein RchiOBHm_Chr4g0385401 [Rosa chinensis]|uniref:Uncharacterized protein n=1 Tax=Rosa chinensis TaxID=74649 RepID=A0A2P6QNX4_ROSCH|nr:hypothetical protein RchiOBHm_Chr4g0385401 [Rosa chinensis]
MQFPNNKNFSQSLLLFLKDRIFSSKTFRFLTDNSQILFLPVLNLNDSLNQFFFAFILCN